MLTSKSRLRKITGNGQVSTAQDRLVFWTLLLLLGVVAVFSIGIGRVYVPADRVIGILVSKLISIAPYWTPSNELIVLGVRLPRILAAVLIGGALAAAGAAYQNLFRNPIVSPDILGVSAGAGFGACLAVIFNLGSLGIQAFAFGTGLFAVTLCFLMGQIINRHSLIVLILVGVVIAAFFQAMISIVKIIVDPVDTLPVITFWLLGGLNRITIRDLPVASSVIVISLSVLYSLRWQVNVMSVGEEDARNLGVNTTLVRVLLVLTATLMTAAAVSIAGIVGWVGLVVPHIARMVVGSGFDRNFSVVIVSGSLFVLLVDDIARAAGQMELPLGIVTSVIGAPLFIVLLLRARHAWT